MKHKYSVLILNILFILYSSSIFCKEAAKKKIIPLFKQQQISIYQKQKGKGSVKTFSSKNVLVCSIPKCGTHLLTTCLHLLTGQKGSIVPYLHITSKEHLPDNNKEFLYFHIYYTPETSAFLAQNDFKGLFIYRDPRDQIISRAYWVLKYPEIHAKFLAKGNKITDIITLLIPDTVNFYNLFLGWMKDPLFYPIKFENLVGPKGGGTLPRQIIEIKRLSEHLGLSLTSQEITFCCNNLFGNTVTFRKGQVGNWRQHFTKEHKDLCKKHINDLLVKLGYEKDSNW